MKTTVTILIAVIFVFFATPIVAQDVPDYLKDTYPKHALKAAIDARKALAGEDAQLDSKTRALISIAVAAQVPCDYCVYIYHKKARAAGASDQEIREAVAAAAQLRHWSTVLNGMGYDFETFKKEVDEMDLNK